MLSFPDPLHPAVVHFPIALSVVAFLFAALARVPRFAVLDPAATLLAVLAAVGAVAAVVTGDLAHEEAVVPIEAQELMKQHDELGLPAAALLVVLAVGRLLLAKQTGKQRWLAYLLVLLLGLGAALIGYQGYLGGRLVYDYGVGTAPALAAPRFGGSAAP